MKFLLWTELCFLSFRSAYDIYKTQVVKDWMTRKKVTAEMLFFKKGRAARYSSGEQQQQKMNSFCSSYKLEMLSTLLSGNSHKINCSHWCQLKSHLVALSSGKLLILFEPKWALYQEEFLAYLIMKSVGTFLRSSLFSTLSQFTKIKCHVIIGEKYPSLKLRARTIEFHSV